MTQEEQLAIQAKANKNAGGGVVMTDKEKFRAEIVRLAHLHLDMREAYKAVGNTSAAATENVLYGHDLSILSFIDSMSQEPLSEDLEEALENKVKAIFDSLEKFDVNDKEKNRVAFGLIELEAFAKMFYNIGKQAGAQWQKEQLIAKAFDFTKEHNTACVLASECLRNHGWFNRERVFNDLFRHLSCVDKLFEGKFSGKTKVIVIKED